MYNAECKMQNEDLEFSPFDYLTERMIFCTGNAGFTKSRSFAVLLMIRGMTVTSFYVLRSTFYIHKGVDAKCAQLLHG